jgi:zinc protease
MTGGAVRNVVGGLVFLLTLLGAPVLAGAVEVQRVVSPSGIEAWLVEDHTNPIIALELSFRGGSALDPAGKAGLANLAAGTIDEGAGALDSRSFQQELNDLSITLRFSAGRDSFGGTLRTLTENRARAFELLRLALTAPRFDDEPVARIRAQILASIKANQEDPGYISGRAFRETLFGEHPYARSGQGTAETLAAIETDDLRRFAAERFARETLIVGVVGDVTPAELGDLLEDTFAGLPTGAGAAEVAEARLNDANGTIVVDMEIPQSVVVFGQRGVKRDDPDYYAAYIMNHILGGGSFSSRLYQEVREKRGLAYSVYSFLNPMAHAALIQGGVATQNGRVAESLDLVRAEWRRMAEEGPTQEELELAKKFLTGSFPLRLSSSGAIADMLVGIQWHDLGIDYLDRRNELIDAVTLEDLRRVARRLLDPESLTVVVVGSPDGIEGEVREASPGG